MDKVQGFDQFLYTFDVPFRILSTAQQIAFSLEYHKNHYNLTSKVEDSIGLPEMAIVREWIDEQLEELRQEERFECDSVKTCIEWFNKSFPGMWHHAHTHDNSFLSGLIYLTESNSETWFSIPSIWSKEYTMLNLSPANKGLTFLKYPTTVGKMIVFPSGLLHSVSEHNNPEPRFSLAFNAFPSGLVGSRSETHHRRFMHVNVNQTTL
jgi:hypothetical protein